MVKTNDKNISIAPTFKREELGKLSIELHKKHKGKISISTKVNLNNFDDLSIAYSPGVATPCLEIQKDPKKAKEYTTSANTIAVISDGTAVLGLGDIGAKAAIPVMEGKAALFKRFAGIDAFPIVLETKEVEEIIKTVKLISSSFGGINLEDISAPRCFEIEERLKAELDIPVFHDDQHGTAVVVLAGIINAMKITGKKKEKLRVVINGSGAAGVAIAKLLYKYGITYIVMCDTKGVISRHRHDLNPSKLELLTFTNPEDVCCMLYDALKGADVFIGVSAAGALKEEMVKVMAKGPMIFGLANPIPEMMPELAKSLGAKIVATGRSDYPNQINNVLVFPGIFKGALEAGVSKITDEMKIEAAIALANLVKNPTVDKIVPGAFDDGVCDAVANAVKKIANKESGESIGGREF